MKSGLPTSADLRVGRSQLDEARRRLDQSAQEDVRIEGDRRLILRSPNGTFWSVTVDDAGALSTISLGTSL